jgi:hypothetical protein
MSFGLAMFIVTLCIGLFVFILARNIKKVEKIADWVIGN